MKNGLGKLGITLGATLAAGIVMADPLGGRVFTYDCTAFFNYDMSYHGDVTLNTKTEATVAPYLYVIGCFGTHWEVDGWGSGMTQADEVISIYHNETLAFDFKDFDDLKKVSGSATGAQSIPMEILAKFNNAVTSALLFNTGFVQAPHINSVMTGSNPLFHAGATNGLIQIYLCRRITVDPSVGPGEYVNYGEICIVRS